MSRLNLVQIGSVPFEPVKVFSGFQTLGSVPAYPTSLRVPTAGTCVGVFDNTKTRNTCLVMGLIAGSNSPVSYDLTGFSQVAGTLLYVPSLMVSGAASPSAGSSSTALGGYLCDHFSTQTFTSSFAKLIEPTDAATLALCVLDMRGFQYVVLRLSGSGTAQALWGVN